MVIKRYFDELKLETAFLTFHARFEPLMWIFKKSALFYVHHHDKGVQSLIFLGVFIKSTFLNNNSAKNDF